MSCPDELTLELWSANALPADEASRVGAHVATCASCAMQLEESRALGGTLSAALDLDQDERDYLARLDLGGAWRARSSTAVSDARWGWLALLAVVAAFVAWTVAGGPVAQLVGTANEVGLATVVVTSALGPLLDLSETLIGISTNPALSLSQPLLAVLALVILVWPRIRSASHYLQGVRS